MKRHNSSMTIQIDPIKRKDLDRIAKVKGLTLSNLVRMILYAEIEIEKSKAA